MNYQEAIDFLFNALPMYQRVGNKAFKKDLSNTIELCRALDNPQHGFKSIHVAGTNGKGSSSHMLSAILQSAGYRVGLYTSPHLKNFTERIRINGQEIARTAVVDFVTSNKSIIEQIRPSFFEMTVAMAFDHFAKESVDIAVIEVGLGGRLDSTNVITPEVSLITNIGYDHMDMLGDTLPQIALEKAGIIKPGVPVVVSEQQRETTRVFQQVAKKKASKIFFTEDVADDYDVGLSGNYQQQNVRGVLKTIEVLREQGWKVADSDISNGLKNVVSLTNLKGRWSVLKNVPLTICDTGHNREAFQYIISQIEALNKQQIHMVLGFVQDKNVADLLKMIPNGVSLTFCQSTVPRAMPINKLMSLANDLGIEANQIVDVNQAIEEVTANASKDDVIFVGGSTFVVAEIGAL